MTSITICCSRSHATRLLGYLTPAGRSAMTKKGNLCASNLPCPTWISPVEKLRCRILLGILGACESTAEWGAYMSQMRKDIFTDRRVIVAERDGGTAIGLSVQEIQEGQWLLSVL